MNILVLSKRQYTHKDLIDDRYGRLWEIPAQLADLGQKISGICLSYRKRKQGKYGFQTSSGNPVEWVSFNLFPSLIRYLIRLHRFFRHSKPDVIWVSSDCLHIIAGVVLGKMYRIPCVADLYDNYEYFGLSSIPGVVPLYRMALKEADAISCVSKPLQLWLQQTCKLKGNICVIENAVATDLFFPRAKQACRDQFDLPKHATIIGTAGALETDRGIENLYQAFALLTDQIAGLHLLVAGVGKREHSIFKHPNVHDMGVLTYELVPLLFNALDVAVICNQENDFARFCYPQKANEILACEIPLVAADVGVMSDLFREHSECLFDPDSAEDLADKIAAQLSTPTVIKIPINTWANQAKKLQQLLLACS